MLRIDQVVGCVSRDVLKDICEKQSEKFKLNVNGYRVSGISQMLPPVRHFPEVFSELSGIPDKAFCMKSVKREFDKSFLDELRENRGDVIVVDQGIDFVEQFKLISEYGVVNADSLWCVGNDGACEKARNALKLMSIDDDPLDFAQRMDFYMDFGHRIIDIYGTDKIIVNVQKCAVQFRAKDGCIRDFPGKQYTLGLKRRFDWMGDVLRRTYAGCRFIELPGLVYSSEDNINGCYQLHPERAVVDRLKTMFEDELERIDSNLDV